MPHTRPLEDHPEFSVRQYDAVREYRVENWRLARDGSGRSLRFYGWTWFDVLFPVAVAVLWPRIDTRTYCALFVAAITLYLHARCTQVLWESVLAIPSFGIQLETHRGLPNIPLFVSRRFIPAVSLRDFIINEGLRRWNVRYYLAAVQQTHNASMKLEVAYENILPYFPVLLHVYRDVHEVMFTRDGHTHQHRGPGELPDDGNVDE